MAQMQMNEQMRRNPSDMDMNGQRPRTPSSDNAPSPNKRPRLEGGGPAFNNVAGRGGGMPPGMFMDGRTNPNMVKSGMDPSQLNAGQYAQLMAQSPSVQARTLAAYENMNLRRPMMPNGMAGPGSPMMQQSGMDFSGTGFVGGNMGSANGPNGNHALQDYQMQLMLLEQQNKKRLLMARQEQNPGDRPDGQPAGYSSPNGSRSGPSPGPSEPMGKRGSPPMGPGGMPQSPLPNGVMPQDRPSPGFMNQSMPPEMFQPKMENGMPTVGPGGTIMRGGPQFHQQQAEMMARVRQAGQIPNAPNWPQGQPPQAPMMQQTPSQQPAQMGTPQARTAMPPPQNLPAANPANGRTASPAPSAAPPTPQQSNKTNPKGKKDPKDRKVNPDTELIASTC